MTLPAARVLNVAMSMMVDATPPDKRHQLVQELTGPYRTVGTKVAREDIDAPAWWHGEEEAFESAQAAMMLPRRRKR